MISFLRFLIRISFVVLSITANLFLAMKTAATPEPFFASCNQEAHLGESQLRMNRNLNFPESLLYDRLDVRLKYETYRRILSESSTPQLKVMSVRGGYTH